MGATDYIIYFFFLKKIQWAGHKFSYLIACVKDARLYSTTYSRAYSAQTPIHYGAVLLRSEFLHAPPPHRRSVYFTTTSPLSRTLTLLFTFSIFFLFFSPHVTASTLRIFWNLPPRRWPLPPRSSPTSNPPSPDWTKSGPPFTFSEFESLQFYFTSIFFFFFLVYFFVFLNFYDRFLFLRSLIGTWYLCSSQWEREERIHQPRFSLPQVNESLIIACKRLDLYLAAFKLHEVPMNRLFFFWLLLFYLFIFLTFEC